MDVDDVLAEDTEVMWLLIYYFFFMMWAPLLLFLDLVGLFCEVLINVSIFPFRTSLKLRLPTVQKMTRSLCLLTLRRKFITLVHVLLTDEPNQICSSVNYFLKCCTISFLLIMTPNMHSSFSNWPHVRVVCMIYKRSLRGNSVCDSSQHNHYTSS